MAIAAFSFAGQEIPLRDPNARCALCGVTGTVAADVITDGATRILAMERYCVTCWPAQRLRLDERDKLESQGFRRSMEASADPLLRSEARGAMHGGATWHGILDMIAGFERNSVPAEWDQQILVELEVTYALWAEEIGEPVPDAVRNFLARFRTGAS